jgi:hypothetical protein
MVDLVHRVVARYRAFQAFLRGGSAEEVGKFELPKGHVFGMEVPEGGSACSKCKWLSEDGKHCGSTYFQGWRKSLKVEDPTLIPKPANRYCCDVFTLPEK